MTRWTLAVIGDGKPLEDANRYVLHFAKGESPPTNATWSVPMYDPQGFYVPNAINRHNLAAWMLLKYNPDGSLGLYIQATLAFEQIPPFPPLPKGGGGGIFAKGGDRRISKGGRGEDFAWMTTKLNSVAVVCARNRGPCVLREGWPESLQHQAVAGISPCVAAE